MKLVKENKVKKRAVFYDGTYYYKTWYFYDAKWFDQHIKLLNLYIPEILNDWILKSNSMTIVMNEIKGTLANTFIHDQAFFNKIYTACLQNIKETRPYAHGDWVLSNIIINKNDEIKFIDWDNINLFQEIAISKKMEFDLKSAFGENYNNYVTNFSFAK